MTWKFTSSQIYNDRTYQFPLTPLFFHFRISMCAKKTFQRYRTNNVFDNMGVTSHWLIMSHLCNSDNLPGMSFALHPSFQTWGPAFPWQKVKANHNVSICKNVWTPLLNIKTHLKCNRKRHNFMRRQNEVIFRLPAAHYFIEVWFLVHLNCSRRV